MFRGCDALTLLACLAVWAGAVAAQEARPNFLSDGLANRVWRLGDRSDELSYDRNAGNEAVLMLNKGAFRQSEVSLSITTDASEIQIFSGEQEISLRLLPDKKYKLSFFTDPERGSIKLQGRPLRFQQRVWENLCKDPQNPTFTLLFPGAKRVEMDFSMRGERIKLKLPHGAGQAPKPADPTDPATAPSVEPAVPLEPPKPAEIDPLKLAQARRAVLSVRVATGEEGVERDVPAFLVSKLGHAVAPLSALQGAASATVVLPGGAKPVPVELWSVNPPFGLAVLKIDPVDIAIAGGIVPLAFQESRPEEDQPVWLVGPDEKDPAALSKGVLLDGVYFQDLPAQVNRTLGFPPASKWMITDAPLTPQTAGSPVINAEGRLVGVSAWIWQADDPKRARSYVLFAGHLQAMVDALPAKPMTFGALSSAVGSTSVPVLAFPRLAVARTTPGAKLQSAANTLRTAVTGLGPQSPPRAGQGVHRQAANLARVTATLDPQNAPREAMEEYFRSVLRQIGRGDQSAFVGAINGQAGPLLAAQVAPGSPVVLVGRKYPGVALAGLGDRTHFVTFQTTQKVFIVRNPDLVEEESGTWVMAGGLLAGYVRGGKGQIVPVIQQGFVATLPSPTAP